jgi:glucokinase
MTSWRIAADVGGTNVRFARVTAAKKLEDLVSWPTKSYTSFVDALSAYVAHIGNLDRCEGAAIGAAGPEQNNTVKLTNGDWIVAAAEASACLEHRPVRVINDLQAIALAIPHLAADDIAPFKTNAPQAKHPERARLPTLAINIGTGFGGSLLIATGTEWISIPCEPGHMKLALASKDAAQFGNEMLSIEDILSGLGLKKYWNGETQHFLDRSPETDSDRQDMERFSRLFGQVCGDLVLATGAWGGVYTCGSVAAAWFTRGDHVAFREAFESKGPMSDRMKTVPLGHITHPQATLIGLATLRL